MERSAIRGAGRKDAGEGALMRRQRCSLTSRHTPRKRGIQYAAASRFHHNRPGILGHPLSRVMTARSVACSYATNCHGFNFSNSFIRETQLRDLAAHPREFYPERPAL